MFERATGYAIPANATEIVKRWADRYDVALLDAPPLVFRACEQAAEDAAGDNLGRIASEAVAEHIRKQVAKTAASYDHRFEVPAECGEAFRGGFTILGLEVLLENGTPYVGTHHLHREAAREWAVERASEALRWAEHFGVESALVPLRLIVEALNGAENEEVP